MGFRFSDLPKMKAGRQIEYLIDEVPVEGYTSLIEQHLTSLSRSVSPMVAGVLKTDGLKTVKNHLDC